MALAGIVMVANFSDTSAVVWAIYAGLVVLTAICWGYSLNAYSKKQNKLTQSPFSIEWR